MTKITGAHRFASLALLVLSFSALSFWAGTRFAASAAGKQGPESLHVAAATLSPTSPESAAASDRSSDVLDTSSLRVALPRPALQLEQEQAAPKQVKLEKKTEEFPFSSARACAASPGFNPDGKVLTKEQLNQLGELMSQWRAASSTIEEEVRTQTRSAIESKIVNGDYTSFRMGESSRPTDGAIASCSRVTRDGNYWVEVFAGDSAALDEAIVLKSAQAEEGKSKLLQYIASL